MRTEKSLITDFTDGNETIQLLTFASPLFLSNLLQIVYNMVDMIVVGQYVGSAGLSGVSQGGMLTVFTTIFCMGFSNSGQILVSQLLGAGRKEELPRVIGTLFSLTAVLGAAMALLLVVFRGVMMDFLRMPPEAWALGSQYVLICGCGLIFTYGYNSIAAILRGMGDSRHPFVFITVSSVLGGTGGTKSGEKHAPPVLPLALADQDPEGSVFPGRQSEVVVFSHRICFPSPFHADSFLPTQCVPGAGGDPVQLILHGGQGILIGRGCGQVGVQIGDHRIPDLQFFRLIFSGIRVGQHVQTDHVVVDPILPVNGKATDQQMGTQKGGAQSGNTFHKK